MSITTEVVVLSSAQAQVSVVEVEPGQVQVTVPGPFGTKIFVGPNPPDDTNALWLDTTAIDP
jgi:hypothetical protein